MPTVESLRLSIDATQAQQGAQAFEAAVNRVRTSAATLSRIGGGGPGVGTALAADFAAVEVQVEAVRESVMAIQGDMDRFGASSHGLAQKEKEVTALADAMGGVADASDGALKSLTVGGDQITAFGDAAQAAGVKVDWLRQQIELQAAIKKIEFDDFDQRVSGRFELEAAADRLQLEDFSRRVDEHLVQTLGSVAPEARVATASIQELGEQFGESGVLVSKGGALMGNIRVLLGRYGRVGGLLFGADVIAQALGFNNVLELVQSTAAATASSLSAIGAGALSAVSVGFRRSTDEADAFVGKLDDIVKAQQRLTVEGRFTGIDLTGTVTSPDLTKEIRDRYASTLNIARELRREQQGLLGEFTEGFTRALPSDNKLVQLLVGDEPFKLLDTADLQTQTLLLSRSIRELGEAQRTVDVENQRRLITGFRVDEDRLGRPVIRETYRVLIADLEEYERKLKEVQEVEARLLGSTIPALGPAQRVPALGSSFEATEALARPQAEVEGYIKTVLGLADAVREAISVGVDVPTGLLIFEKSAQGLVETARGLRTVEELQASNIRLVDLYSVGLQRAALSAELALDPLDDLGRELLGIEQSTEGMELGFRQAFLAGTLGAREFNDLLAKAGELEEKLTREARDRAAKQRYELVERPFDELEFREGLLGLDDIQREVEIARDGFFRDLNVKGIANAGQLAEEYATQFERVLNLEKAEDFAGELARSFGDATGAILLNFGEIEEVAEATFSRISAQLLEEFFLEGFVDYLQGVLFKLLGGIGGGIGGGGGSQGGGGGLVLPDGSAKGNVFNMGQIVPFALGGIFGRGGSLIDVPTLFPLAGGRTGLAGEGGNAEAVVPLGRGRGGRLGVEVVGGGGGGTTVYNLNIRTPDVGGFQRSQRQIVADMQRRSA